MFYILSKSRKNLNLCLPYLCQDVVRPPFEVKKIVLHIQEHLKPSSQHAQACCSLRSQVHRIYITCKLSAMRIEIQCIVYWWWWGNICVESVSKLETLSGPCGLSNFFNTRLHVLNGNLPIVWKFVDWPWCGKVGTQVWPNCWVQNV